MLRISAKAVAIVLVVACILAGTGATSLATTAVVSAAPTITGVLYEQPPSTTAALYISSWWSPNESAYDQWVWDAFSLSTAQTITEIRWRGGYDPQYLGWGGPVVDFTVSIYRSDVTGRQPDLIGAPMVEYAVGGNAGEAAAGQVGNIEMYDYAFVLPTPLQVTAGTNYWLQIEGTQNGFPDWGIAAGTNGDGTYFRRPVGNVQYQTVPGDTAFALLGPTAIVQQIRLPLILK